MLAQGWVAEGYGPDAVIMCAVPASTAARGQLLIRAWKPDGSLAALQDFVDYTHYVNGQWSMYGNYGAFPAGKPAAVAQAGSGTYPLNVGGTDYVALDVPSAQALYFTALWRAPSIGTVYMRADNGGAGYTLAGGGTQKLELPYDFAVSEFRLAQSLVPATGLSTEAQRLLTAATSAMSAAQAASSSSARAVAAYTALSYVMPLKERLVLDASNAVNATLGTRADFDLNYEGFGSWTDSTQATGYAVARDAGFKSVYTVVDWNLTSPAQGTYDFTTLDYQVDEARKQGFQVALQINPNYGNLPAWAKGLPFAALKALYFENARRVVARYGTKVAVYYACGELELASYPMTLGQMAELARQSLAGARNAAPGTPFGIYASASAYVGYQMNPGTTPTFHSSQAFVELLVRSRIAFDFVGLEMQYGTVFAPIDLQRFKEVLDNVHAAAGVPLYMGESGYSSKSQDYGIAAGFYWHEHPALSRSHPRNASMTSASAGDARRVA